MHHTFTPDPSVPGMCDECGMPKANRRHAPEPAAEPAPTPLRSATENYAHTAVSAGSASAAAALKAAPQSGSIKARILEVIAAAGAMRGVTDKELETYLPDIGANSLRPRRIDLRNDGWLTPAVDEWHDEVTRDGATAWTLTPAARATLGSSAA